MIRNIKIGDTEHPITFSNKVIGIWSHAMGISMVSFSGIGHNLDLFQAAHLLYYGLQEGYNKQKLPFKYTMDDIWEMTETDTDLLERTFRVLAESRNIAIDKDMNVVDEKKIVN